MQLVKNKPIRIKGSALRKLHEEVYELDGGNCVLCGVGIPEGTPAHHVNHGKNKEDVKENMVMLDDRCHREAHFGNDPQAIKFICKLYLRERDKDNKWNK